MSMIYFDTCALLKRVLHEADSLAFRQYLRENNTPANVLLTSVLTRVELTRSLRRVGTTVSNVVKATQQAMSGIALFPLSTQVLDASATVGPDHLRTLDALHLASALASKTDIVVTYDQRLRVAVQNMGITVQAPS